MVQSVDGWLDSIDLKLVMRIHAGLCIVVGVAAASLPHTLLPKTIVSSYNHAAHEYVRLYGCMTMGVGWLVWRSQDVRDGRLMRAIAEAFAACYSLQALVMLRAQFTNPSGHSLLHWFIALLFLLLGSLYTNARLRRKIKGFELPGHAED